MTHKQATLMGVFGIFAILMSVYVIVPLVRIGLTTAEINARHTRLVEGCIARNHSQVECEAGYQFWLDRKPEALDTFQFIPITTAELSPDAEADRGQIPGESPSTVAIPLPPGVTSHPVSSDAVDACNKLNGSEYVRCLRSFLTATSPGNYDQADH